MPSWLRITDCASRHFDQRPDLPFFLCLLFWGAEPGSVICPDLEGPPRTPGRSLPQTTGLPDYEARELSVRYREKRSS